MATRVRSYSKINLGLAIGPVRPDGFHGLTTLYQTLDLHDLVTVSAKRAGETQISLTTNHPFVPRDGRNTAWRMVERALARLGVTAEVEIHIEKRLPVQGGMGAGSANAATALLGLERELGVALPGVERLRLAAAIGSDVPLFLLGGAVMGAGRGEQVTAMRDLPKTWCVVAVPSVGVSTPAAFKAWDVLVAERIDSTGHLQDTRANAGILRFAQDDDLKGTGKDDDLKGGGRDNGVEGAGRDDWGEGGRLTSPPPVDKLQELSLAYSSLSVEIGESKPRSEEHTSELQSPC